MRKTIIIVKALSFVLAIGFLPLSLAHAQNREKTENSIKDLPKISVSSAMGNFSAGFSGHSVSSDFEAFGFPKNNAFLR